MNREQSRRECSALVADLDLPDPFDLGDFTQVTRYLDHPLRLRHPWSQGAIADDPPRVDDLTGTLWLALAEASLRCAKPN